MIYIISFTYLYSIKLIKPTGMENIRRIKANLDTMENEEKRELIILKQNFANLMKLFLAIVN